VKRRLAAALLLGAAMTAAAAAAQSSKSMPPNFVLLLADDLGYGDVEINGASVNRTPNLARLAAEGVRLTSFYAAGNWCMPTRASILTASYPRRIGLDRGSDALSPAARSARGLAAGEITLPELLRASGYATALAGKWHLGDQPDFLPTRHGFDRFFGLLHPNDGGREGFLRWGAMRSDTGYFPLALMRGETVIESEPDQAMLTRRYTDEAIRFIEASRDRPFFLFLSYSMPHKPAHASPAFAGRSRGGVYGDAIEEVDASVGDVLSTLERLGLDSRTLVVFTSDNGAGRGWGSNAPLRGWKKTTLEGGLRVPFVARWPGHAARGKSSGELVASMDLMPTFARLAGVRLPSDRVLDGRDVWPVLAGEAGARSPRESFLYYDGGRLEGVRDRRWKLWFGRVPEEAGAGTGAGSTPHAATVAPLLYDLDADVAETTDVASSHPDVVERLEALAHAARRDLGDDATGVKGARTRAPGLVEAPHPLTEFVSMKTAPTTSGPAR
jgi:arylsulfatase A-like enzyme